MSKWKERCRRRCREQSRTEWVALHINIMRKIIQLTFIALLSVSCSGKKQVDNTEGTENITFDSIVVEEVIKLFPDKLENTLSATLNISFTFPTTFGSDEKLQKLQAVFYKKVLGDEFVEATLPQEAVERYMKSYADFYRKDINEMYKDEIDEILLVNPTAFSYGRDVKNKIIFVNENLVSFTNYNWEYTSGAHGYASQFNHIISLQTFELIPFSQVLKSNYKEFLLQVIKEKLLLIMAEKTKDYRDTPVSDDGLKSFFFDYDAIELTENFLQTDIGLIFTYNPYDIAAYASGLFEVKVPYAEISELLNLETLTKLLSKIDLQKETSNTKQLEMVK